jgi:hypothetical protein
MALFVANSSLPDEDQHGGGGADAVRWGLDNGLGRYLTGPDSEQMVSRINRMENWEPRRAMAFLTNPEDGEDEEVLNAAMLAASETRQEAAALLLENLHSAMVATPP